MTRIKTVREWTSVPSQLAGIVAVVVPPLGLVTAVWLLWERGVRPVDLVLLAGFYVACGLGITVGFHRLFTHKSFETGAPLRGLWAILGSMAMQGPVTRGSPTTASTTRFPTGRATRTPRTPGTATRWPSTCSGCGLAHRLALLDQGPRTRGRVRRDLYEDRLVRGIDRLYLLWVA